MTHSNKPLFTEKPASRCPVCGNLNQCVMAEPPSVTPNAGAPSCWCMSVNLNDQAREYLKASTDGQSCLCRQCLSALKAR